MKRTIIMMAAAAILATGCKNNSNNQNDTAMSTQKESVGQFQAFPKSTVTKGFSIYGHEVRSGKAKVEKWLKSL